MKSLIILILSLCLVHKAECVEAAPPNIVFILIDDLRYDTFGFMGHPFVETPHIDALAKGRYAVYQCALSPRRSVRRRGRRF